MNNPHREIGGGYFFAQKIFRHKPTQTSEEMWKVRKSADPPNFFNTNWDEADLVKRWGRWCRFGESVVEKSFRLGLTYLRVGEYTKANGKNVAVRLLYNIVKRI